MLTIETIRKSEAAVAAAQAGDFDACSEFLIAKSIVVRDSTPITYAMLTRDFGPTVQETVADTLRMIAASPHPQAGQVADAHVILLNEHAGLRIDVDERQATIDLIAAAGNWPDSLRDAIKARGKRLTSIAQQEGLSDDLCDAAACESVWKLEQVKTLRDGCQKRFDVMKNQLGTSEQPLAAAALRAMADEWSMS